MKEVEALTENSRKGKFYLIIICCCRSAGYASLFLWSIIVDSVA